MTLSRKVFEQGLEEIENSFSGFSMTKIKADIWYKYSKYITNEDWLIKIENCIKGCNKNPTLADIIDWRGYYINKKEEVNLWLKQEEIKWYKIKKEDADFEHKPIPKKVKEYMDKFLGRNNK